MGTPAGKPEPRRATYAAAPERVLNASRFVPRYAPEVSLLRHDQGHLRRAAAPAFWALVPFHVQQPDDVSCGPASVAVVLGALRARAGHAPPQVDHNAVVTLAGGPRGEGFTLVELADLVSRGLAAAELEGEVAAVHMEDPGAVAGEIRGDLGALEAGRIFLIANFAVAPLLGVVDVGHHSPIGGYDAATDRVLVLDVYRRTFEPYWAPASLLIDAMAAVDPMSGRARGYVKVAPAS